MSSRVKRALAAAVLAGVALCAGCEGCGAAPPPRQGIDHDTPGPPSPASPPAPLDGVRVRVEDAGGSAPRGTRVTRVEVRGPGPVSLRPGFSLAAGDPGRSSGGAPPLRFDCGASTRGCVALVPGAEWISPPWRPGPEGVRQCGALASGAPAPGARAVVRSCDGAGWAASAPLGAGAFRR